MKYIKYFSLLIFPIFFGCGAGQIAIKQPEQKNPIQVSNENLPRISVAKINSSLIPGQVIGGRSLLLTFILSDVKSITSEKYIKIYS